MVSRHANEGYTRRMVLLLSRISLECEFKRVRIYADVINKHEEGSSPSRNVQPFLLKRKILAILVFVPTGSTERRIGLRAVSSRDKSREEEAVASVWSVKFHRDRVMRAPIK